ncbi:ABC-2 family transporter protein [Candidatus Daviesbacteria bacterium]|nr:ABC-2 family transporter protein [Candidatus Daviesbacteria bacterium]
MSDTLAVFKIAWQQQLVYRLNFVLWRMRTILQFLLVYFIWWTIFQSNHELFGYNESSILTYILLVVLIRALVLSSRANDVMNKINDGSIANFLLKPISFIKYYFAQDVADKLANSMFMIFELGLIIIIFKPQIIIQENILNIFLFISAFLLGTILWFCMNMIIGLMAFWVENSWGPFFLIMIFMEGLGGGLFPIDILPKYFFNFLMLTPFPYIIYFPAKVYLGGFQSNDLLIYFSILILWTVTLWILMNRILKMGLKHYTSGGN